jgi:sugar phosphate isomerase/epimerase
MSHDTTIIWAPGAPDQRRWAAPLLACLDGQTRVITLGREGDPAPDLCLSSESDLGLALESCPPSLRPHACLWVAAPGQASPRYLEGLPCPVLGWGADAPEGRLPDDAQAAAQALLAAAARGLDLPWMSRVQINMPLSMLLDRHLEMVKRLPLNLEVGIDWQALESRGPDDLELARLVLQGRRVTAHLPFGDLVPGSPDPKVAALAGMRLTDAARWAVSLGAVQVVMHLGLDSRMHPDPGLYAQRLAQTLAPFVAALNRGGCRLALENVFEAAPEPLLLARRALMEAGAQQVGFCLDVGHARSFSSTPLDQWLAQESPHIFEFHLHDNDGTGDLHLPPGQGLTDWAALNLAIRAMDPAPILTLEPHSEPHLWASLRSLERLWATPDQ